MTSSLAIETSQVTGGTVMAQGYRGRVEGASTLDTSNMKYELATSPLPTWHHKAASPTINPCRIYHPDSYHSLFDLIRCFPPDPMAPDHADEASSDTPALTNGIRPHKPCPRDPGHLPMDITTPFSPPINEPVLRSCSRCVLYMCTH